ncbi:MAG TPA: AMP-binding protein, partial [Bacillota bacterium]|nr:AMP-binding protein [Bacillota bacterium]
CHTFAYPLGHIATAKHWHNVDPDGLHLTVADTGWGKAVWGKLYGQWIMEAAVFVYDFDKFVPADLLGKIEKYKITTFCAPPTIYRFFIKEGIEGYNLSSLKYATTAGEALNPEVFNRFYQYTGLKIMEGFGQTETTLTIFNWIGMEPKPGSMGKPSPQYEVLVVDENCKPVPTGEIGEIVICTKHSIPAGLFSGYHNDKEKTESAWHDGYYHTGDTAWLDEDGYLWYVGRNDDIIKSSGYRISPFEIESVLIEHPAVLECAVTGTPDPVRGQVVKATVVLTRNYVASDELANELKDYVKHATAPYKYPRMIEFVSELPKTINGKIRRVEIREKSK